MPMPTRSSSDSWNEYKRLVLSELQRLNDCAEKLRTDQEKLRIEMSKSYDIIYKSTDEKIKTCGEAIMLANAERVEQYSNSIQKDMSDLNAKINALNETIEKSGVQELKKHSITFWTSIITALVAVITIIGSMLLK